MQGGDVVEAVDGKAVTCDTLVDAIRGADMPGSKMEMQLRGPDKTLRTVALLVTNHAMLGTLRPQPPSP